MTALANERVAYLNGKIVPERDVLIPFRDRGFMAGDAVFDTARTVSHRIFKPQGAYRPALQLLALHPGRSASSPKEMSAITEDVLARNLHLLVKPTRLLGQPARLAGLNTRRPSPAVA